MKNNDPISEGSVFPDYLEVATAVDGSVWGLVKLHPVHRNSVDISSYSGPIFRIII